jgi:hypothetical protein
MESQFFSLVSILGTITVCTVFLWYGSRFEREIGTRVTAVYDTEKVKSTEVMNRLDAEKNNPP